MNTSTEALFAAVVAAAQAANEREATLATFAHLLAQAAGADAAHVYLYDDARRLIPHRDASLDLLQEHWATVGQSIWQQRALEQAGCVIVPLVATQVAGVALMTAGLVGPTQLLVLSTVGQLLAGALAHHDLQAALARQRCELDTLRALNHVLFDQLPVDAQLEQVAHVAEQLSGGTRCLLFLCDQEGWLRPVLRQAATARRHVAVPVDGSRIGAIVRSGQPRVLTIETAEWNLPASRSIPPIIDMLAVPLCRGGRPVGVLTVIGAPASFSNEQIRVVARFAEYAAIAIDQSSRRFDPVDQRADQLTEREVQVLTLIAQGQSNQEIARTLAISERTVSTHLSNILGKLGLSHRTQAALYALRIGLPRR